MCEFLQETISVVELNNPGDGLDDAKDVAKDGVNQMKSETIQHLLSDWRGAISKQPKIKQPGAPDRTSKKEGQLDINVRI